MKQPDINKMFYDDYNKVFDKKFYNDINIKKISKSFNFLFRSFYALGFIRATRYFYKYYKHISRQEHEKILLNLIKNEHIIFENKIKENNKNQK